MSNIVDVNHVSMRFNLAKERTDTIKEFFVKTLKKQLFFNEFYALKDISFQVKRGESVALIGRNGSGKSTMLKIIAGVIAPTCGNVSVRGSMAPLIELGAGFDGDLTARENIYLNGAVLGYDRQFMKRHFDSIIDFAELDEFVDVPVKNFSTGMVARLGFSIATEVAAEVLIVDEVLSVGDYAFQEKCMERMNKLLEGDTTLIYVSHGIESVKRLCKRAIWLDSGVLMMDGSSAEVCAAYQPE